MEREVETVTLEGGGKSSKKGDREEKTKERCGSEGTWRGETG